MSNDEPAKIYVIYQSKIRRSNRRGNPDLTYLDQISKYLSTDKTVRFSAEEISQLCQGQAAVEPKYCHAQVPPEDDDGGGDDDDDDDLLLRRSYNFKSKIVLMQFIKVLVFSVFLYGVETWTIMESEK